MAALRLLVIISKDDPRWPAVRARLEINRAPVAHATTVFALPHDDLVPEGLAWDPRSRTFLVSSVHARKILSVDEHGAARDFVSSAREGVGALCGIASDAERLWVTMATLPPMFGFDPKGWRPTALLAYDLATGGLRVRADLPVDDGHEHALTDVTVAPRGDVYVSDEPGGVVYALAPGASRLEPLVRAGSLLSPQTPAVSLDGRRLYVPDYVRGIAMLDLTSRALTWIVPAAGVALDGDRRPARRGRRSDRDPARRGATTHRSVHTRCEWDPGNSRRGARARLTGARRAHARGRSRRPVLVHRCGRLGPVQP